MLRTVTVAAVCLGLAACAHPNPDNPMEGLIMSRHAPPGPGQLIGLPMPGPAQPGGEAACDAPQASAGAEASASVGTGCE